MGGRGPAACEELKRRVSEGIGMNWFARNLAVMLFGAAISVFTAVVLIFVEARTGTTVFGLSLLRFVPLGAIGAGLVGAFGYWSAGLALRLRPGVADVLVILGVAAFVVFLAQSAEFSFFMNGPAQAVAATRDTATFTRFLGSSVAQSPLDFWSGGGGGDNSASAIYFSGATSGPSQFSGGGGDSRVEGISSGVQGMMASQDASNSAAAQHMTKLEGGIEDVGAKVKSHGSVWTMLLVQMLGFAAGGIAVFGYLRSLPHCKSCMLLLNVKGRKIRYFSRTREMRSSVDEVLMRARDKQLQQSILFHMTKGSEKKQQWSEYCSVLEIRRCMQCRIHQMDFRARRKDGATWKDIALMGFSASTLEPVDFAR